MTDVNEQSYDAWIGHQVVDRDGNKIGKISQIYVDDQTGRPEWLAVNTGLFSTKSSLIPLNDAAVQGDQLSVPYDKTMVKDAPQVDDDGEGLLVPEEEEDLYRYYGLHYASFEAGGGDDQQGAQVSLSSADADSGRDTSGPNTDQAMTRSEERLRVGTERRETGRVRLRKYVVTEQVTQTVPVSHEEVRLEREPITDANRDAATAGPEISEEEHEVTLHEERPVVQKEIQPVERIRLTKNVVTGEETVGDEVRKEVIETDGDEAYRPTR